MVSKPICRHCVVGVQLFKWCRNLSAGTVLQRCSWIRGVKTYLPGLCSRGAAVQVVSKPICRHCVAEVQLFKRCQNLCVDTVLQRCSCLSSVSPICRALCCRDAAVLAVLQPICRHCAAGVQQFKWCGNLSAWTVLQRCSCLSGVKIYV